MEGIARLIASLGLAALLCSVAGGCIHSDSARSGVVDGRYWCERVADDVSQPYIDELRGELLALGNGVSAEEAQTLADVSVRHADHIRRAWGIVRPIELHNVMVNMGLRKRGLCYQCAEAMYERLHALDLKTFDLHWGVAHKGDLWLEHSGVIVTARGRPFAEGLVVDAWRHSGRLRWARVADDRYPWSEMIKWKYPETARLAQRGEAAARRRDAGAEPGAAEAVPAAAAIPRAKREADGAAPGEPARDGGGGSEAPQRADSRAEAGRASTSAAAGKQLSTMVTTRASRQWP